MVFGQQVGEKKLRQRLCLLGLFIKIVKISLQSITGVYPFLEFSVMLIIFVSNLGPLSVISYFMMKITIETY
jgi:hypothetical protein